MLSLYVSCQFLFIIWPLFEYYWNGAIETPLPTRLPGVDIANRNDFIILTSFHLFMLTIAGAGLGYFDGIMAVFTFNILAFSGLIRNQVKQLNQMFLMDKKHSKPQIYSKFRNIILMHQEMNE